VATIERKRDREKERKKEREKERKKERKSIKNIGEKKRGSDPGMRADENGIEPELREIKKEKE
jgi:hypothetical protein